MKKFIAILVLCCYSAGVFGVDISLHYCGGNFHSISFKSREDNGCCSKMKKKMRCCRDKNLSYKLSEKHAAQHVFHHHHANDLVAVLPVVYYNFNNDFSLPGDRYVPVSHSPPDIQGPELYLLHNIFRI